MKEFLDDETRQRVMAAVRARRQLRTFQCAYCGQDATGYEKARFCSPLCRLHDYRKRHRPTPPTAPPASEAD